MDKFIFSPDDCLILKSFKETSSLREAAKELGCDPAGLARRVQWISANFGFLQKVNNRWQLTARGLDLVAWAEESIQSQKKVLSGKSSVRFASTMWFSEEVLLPNIFLLKEHTGSQYSFSVPSKNFEMALLDGSVDFVIVCHPPENPEIEHKQLLQEEWILIAPPDWKKLAKLTAPELLTELRTRPYVRHNDINEDLFLPQIGSILDSGITVDNLIGVRSAVYSGLGWSIVPKFLVARSIAEKRLLELNYDVQVHDRKICVWWQRNRVSSKSQASKICSWVKEICS